jgi:hypothetical protein
MDPILKFKKILAEFKKETINAHTLYSQDNMVIEKVNNIFVDLYRVLSYILENPTALQNESENIKSIRKLFEPVFRNPLTSFEKIEIRRCAKLNLIEYPSTIDQESITHFLTPEENNKIFIPNYNVDG